MTGPRSFWLLAGLLLVGGCRKYDPEGEGRSPAEGPPAFAFRPPGIGIDVVERDRRIVFVFKTCGDPKGQPFVDRLIVQKIKPSNEAGVMCSFESPSEEGVLRKPWEYGAPMPGFDRCWPLTEGTYSVVAIGSGSGETTFRLKKAWFGSGFSSTILESSCKV